MKSRAPETEREIDASVPVTAVETMPWWGRALSWVVWRFPIAWFTPVVSAGAIGLAYGYVESHAKSLRVGGWMVGLPLAVSIVLLLCRRLQPDPFAFAVRVFYEDEDEDE